MSIVIKDPKSNPTDESSQRVQDQGFVQLRRNAERTIVLALQSESHQIAKKLKRDYEFSDPEFVLLVTMAYSEIIYTHASPVAGIPTVEQTVKRLRDLESNYRLSRLSRLCSLILFL